MVRVSLAFDHDLVEPMMVERKSKTVPECATSVPFSAVERAVPVTMTDLKMAWWCQLRTRRR